MTVLEHSFSKKQVAETQRKARNLRARMVANGASRRLRTDVRSLIEIIEFVAEVRTKSVSGFGTALTRPLEQTLEEITPQQAAEILGMSRPSVMRLIDNGCLHTRKVLTRNKLSLREVKEFHRENTNQQRQALNELSAFSEEFDF